MYTIASLLAASSLPAWQISMITNAVGLEELTKEINVLAVDGDIVAYRTAAVCENEFEGSCAAIIDATLRDISTESGVHYMRIYLSDKTNFRYDLAKTKPYKGNRDGFVRPKFLQYCKDYLREKYAAITVEHGEADDGIASDMVINGAIHCGIDKDILQIAGKHYNYVNKTWQTVTPEEAVIRLYRQVLMGDASDNVPGLPRVGEKTAEKAIMNHETAEQDALQFYKETCNLKLPGVNYIEYMAEQLSLIKMKTDHEVAKIGLNSTVFVVPNTGGFESQEGDFSDVEVAEPQTKVAPRL